MRAFSLCAMAAVMATTAPASATLVYSNDFDAPEFVANGVTATGLTNGSLQSATVGSWNASGWSGNFFNNDSTGNPALVSVLTLTGLAANSAVSLSGIIGLLDSWDSNDGCCGFAPDYLDFYFNGSLVASLTSNTALGSLVDLGGATVIAYGQQVDNHSGYYSDTLGDLSTASFISGNADATGTFTLGIGARGQGWQGGGDESWGIDNLQIDGTVARQTTSPVPEPATWAMMLVGFGAVGAAMRRRQKVAVSFA